MSLSMRSTIQRARNLPLKFNWNLYKYKVTILETEIQSVVAIVILVLKSEESTKDLYLHEVN